MRNDAKERMIREDLEARGIHAPAVLRAMRAVAREEFVSDALRSAAYDDGPLPLSAGQTLSQPYIVAAMTQLLHLTAASHVLEIGSGSGYQAAVLAEIAAEVHSVERIPTLAARARINLDAAGADRVHVHIGDGWDGWPDAAPYDAIIVTAAPARVPEPLIQQLRPGGRLVIPVGPVDRVQTLLEIHKQADGQLLQIERMAVRFVPLISPQI